MAVSVLLLPRVWIKKMRTLGLWTVAAAAFLLLICCNCVADSSISSTSPGGFKAELSNRKLKDIVSTINTAVIEDDSSSYNLDDYPGNDPSPSSKVDVHAGPIENRSPFMPYFIRPTPPPPHPL